MRNLDQRIERLEKTLGVNSGLPALLTGWYEPLDSGDPELQSGVDGDGEALISPYWSVWFIEGTKEEQERELKLHRVNSKYKQPPWEAPNWGELHVEYINGGCVEMIFERFSEKEGRAFKARVESGHQPRSTWTAWSDVLRSDGYPRFARRVNLEPKQKFGQTRLPSVATS
jgi:hypothetical protein